MDAGAKMKWVSLTGAEDSVDPVALAQLGKEHPHAEWALLYVQEREGQGRNPSQAWRERFLSEMESSGGRSALHLCARQSFERLLSEGVWDELKRYSRIQANLNSRGDFFDKDQAFKIWDALAGGTGGLIIQLHDAVEPWASEWMQKRGLDPLVTVLFDESKGRGKMPGVWRSKLEGIGCGYAGGLGPENIAEQMPAIVAAAGAPGCWIDMETRLRTDGLFDLDKCRLVLESAAPWLAPKEAAPALAKVKS